LLHPSWESPWWDRNNSYIGTCFKFRDIDTDMVPCYHSIAMYCGEICE
jgi:hypothetical protein